MELEQHDVVRISISCLTRPRTSISKPRTIVREDTVALWVPTTNRIELVKGVAEICAATRLHVSFNGNDPERAITMSIKYERGVAVEQGRPLTEVDAEAVVTHAIDFFNRPPVEVLQPKFPAGTTRY